MGELRSRVRNVIHRYINDKLTDEEFKEQIKEIIEEYREKLPESLIYQDIGLVVWEREHKLSSYSKEFKKIWILLEQIEPKIKEKLNQWEDIMKK